MKSIYQFLVGLFLIYCFVWQVVPFLTQGETAVQVRQQIEEQNIEAGALFYTESEQAIEAHFFFQKNKKNDYK